VGDSADILLLWRKRFYDKNQNQLSKICVSRVLQAKRKTATCDAGNSQAPRSKTGSFRKMVVHVGDYEKQFLRVIVCCAFGKLSGAFGSVLPGPIKRRPPSGLYKETMFMGFPGYFQRSHHSLQDQLKSLHAAGAYSGVLPSLRLPVLRRVCVNDA
jgi:hypothetical protein